jgi:peptidoglycan/LPS O-acetylase OafA/YrhL
MVWQFIAPVGHHIVVPTASQDVPAELVLLAVLLGLMALLAFARFSGMRRADRYLGNLTYPLYLYHEDVLVLLLIVTAGYSYGVFLAGMGLSLLVAALAYATLDPLVNRWRDRVRGRSLDADPRHGRRAGWPAAGPEVRNGEARLPRRRLVPWPARKTV